MKLQYILILSTIWLVLSACSGGPIISPDIEAEQESYVEPELRSVDTETVSVIVTAKHDWEAAARAVDRAGGQVTSELWVIQAVAADIPANKIDQIAADPEIRSVVLDKRVEGSSETSGDG